MTAQDSHICPVERTSDHVVTQRGPAKFSRSQVLPLPPIHAEKGLISLPIRWGGTNSKANTKHLERRHRGREREDALPEGQDVSGLLELLLSPPESAIRPEGTWALASSQWLVYQGDIPAEAGMNMWSQPPSLCSSAQRTVTWAADEQERTTQRPHPIVPSPLPQSKKQFQHRWSRSSFW